MAWNDSLKTKIGSEVCYPSDRKALYVGLVDSAVAAHPSDPAAALLEIANKINGLADDRSPTLEQFVRGVLWQYERETARAGMSEAQDLQFLDDVINQKINWSVKIGRV